MSRKSQKADSSILPFVWDAIKTLITSPTRHQTEKIFMNRSKEVGIVNESISDPFGMTETTLHFIFEIQKPVGGSSLFFYLSYGIGPSGSHGLSISVRRMDSRAILTIPFKIFSTSKNSMSKTAMSTATFNFFFPPLIKGPPITVVIHSVLPSALVHSRGIL